MSLSIFQSQPSSPSSQPSQPLQPNNSASKAKASSTPPTTANSSSKTPGRAPPKIQTTQTTRNSAMGKMSSSAKTVMSIRKPPPQMWLSMFFAVVKGACIMLASRVPLASGRIIIVWLAWSWFLVLFESLVSEARWGCWYQSRSLGEMSCAPKRSGLQMDEYVDRVGV